MRISIASGAVIASTLFALAGCSTTGGTSSQSSFWEKLGLKSKTSTTSGTALSSAPPAPLFNSAAPAAPSVSMPPAQTASNMPLYPGTNYPVTPYQATAAPASVAANPPTYPASPPTTVYPNAVAGPAASGPDSQPAGSVATSGQAPPYAPPAVPYNAANPNGTYTR